VAGGTFNNASANLVAVASAGFVNAAGRDYHLQGSSPAVNAATGSTITVDRDNNPRVGTPDLGAFEVQPPSVQFGGLNFAFPETAGKATVTVVIPGAGAGRVSVTLSTSDGSAHAGVDYTAVTTTLTFSPGETQKTVDIPIFNDNKRSGDRRFKLSLSKTKRAGAGFPGQGRVAPPDPERGE